MPVSKRAINPNVSWIKTDIYINLHENNIPWFLASFILLSSCSSWLHQVNSALRLLVMPLLPDRGFQVQWPQDLNASTAELELFRSAEQCVNSMLVQRRHLAAASCSRWKTVLSERLHDFGGLMRFFGCFNHEVGASISVGGCVLTSPTGTSVAVQLRRCQGYEVCGMNGPLKDQPVAVNVAPWCLSCNLDIFNPAAWFSIPQNLYQIGGAGVEDGGTTRNLGLLCGLKCGPGHVASVPTCSGMKLASRICSTGRNVQHGWWQIWYALAWASLYY